MPFSKHTEHAFDVFKYRNTHLNFHSSTNAFSVSSRVSHWGSADNFGAPCVRVGSGLGSPQGGIDEGRAVRRRAPCEPRAPRRAGPFFFLRRGERGVVCCAHGELKFAASGAASSSFSHRCCAASSAAVGQVFTVFGQSVRSREDMIFQFCFAMSPNQVSSARCVPADQCADVRETLFFGCDKRDTEALFHLESEIQELMW